MHYVIIGAGAIGGTIGGQLHRHGHRVTLVARGTQVGALRERGLRLTTPQGQWRLDIPVVSDPAELPLEPDCALIVAVKSQHTRAVLDAWVDQPVAGGGTAGDTLPLVCAQNGVANERSALRRFARVYGMCVWLPATHLEPGAVLARAEPYLGMLHLGRYPAGSDVVATQVASDLSGSGFLAPVRDDVMRWKYGKLLGNLVNGITALFGRNDRELYAQARVEGTTALAAAGIAYTSSEEDAAARGDQVRVPPGDGQGAAASVPPAHRLGSTWQSLARRTGTAEVDYLNGEIVLIGREHGVPTPVNHAIQRAVRQAAHAGTAPGEFPVDQFRAQLAG